MTTIPKTIHYCWFGGKPLPREAMRCLESWRRHCPDWEIRRWDESNFDINEIAYTREAASCGKWAFVSDYARFKILFEHGGVYLDTDVELLRPLDDIIAEGPFMGFEKSHVWIGVNSGLGIGSPAGHNVYEKVISHYSTMHFLDNNGNQLPGTVVKHVTDLLLPLGLVLEDRKQTIAGICIYPNEYFNPLDDATGRLNITPNTCSIHHYAKTWCDNYGPMRTRLMRFLHRHLGVETLGKLRKFLLRS